MKKISLVVVARKSANMIAVVADGIRVAEIWEKDHDLGTYMLCSRLPITHDRVVIKKSWLQNHVVDDITGNQLYSLLTQVQMLANAEA